MRVSMKNALTVTALLAVALICARNLLLDKEIVGFTQRTDSAGHSVTTDKTNVIATDADSRELEKKYFATRDNVVNRLPDQFLRNVKPCDPAVFMIVVVLSLHNEYKRRRAIRKTWGEATSWADVPRGAGADVPRGEGKEQVPSSHISPYRVVFMLGTHWSQEMETNLTAESEKYQDIVQGDFEDSYRNLTLKSLATLHWISKYCPHATYAIKCDDDTMINVPFLQNYLTHLRDSVIARNSTLQLLKPQTASSNDGADYMVGALSSGGEVYRNGKWKVNEWQYPFDIYPKYLAGPAYVIPTQLVAKLYQTAFYVPLIYIEDVYVTGILSKVLNVTLVHSPSFCYTNGEPPTACDVVLGRTLTATNINATYLQKLWRSVQNAQVTCDEYQLRTTPKRADVW